MGRGSVEQVVSALAEPIAAAHGLELVGVTFQKEHGRWHLRLTIDRPEGRVRMADCEAVSQAVSRRLDEVDPIGHEYYLEVQSPGPERPLAKDEDFRRFAGRRVRLALYAPVGGRRELAGELAGADAGTVRVVVDGSEIAVARSNVARARLVRDL